MLFSEKKPIEEILRSLEGEPVVFVVGCGGCADGCRTGGEPEVREMKARLEEAGKRIGGSSLIDMVCNESLTRLRLDAHQTAINSSDSLIVLSCGAGVQAVAAVVDRMVHPGCNTLSLSGAHAEWKDGKHCLECGNCVLDWTGGICPIARCAKNLFNGPCGGSQGGFCEISPELPCAWQLVIDRMTRIGRLDRLEEIVPPKDWSVSLTGGPPRDPWRRSDSRN